ncbi:MAG: SPW repeat protein [Rubrobacter sp.]|nr:SPW repeat protein [Rubrobacter sp.]
MMVAWRVPIVSGHVAASLISIVLAGWLLISPFALGFAGSTAAWCAWTAGTLALALSVNPEAIFDVAAWPQARRLRHGIRRISPQQIASYEEPVQTVSPQMLSRSIVERAHEIQHTLRRHPPAPESEMCVVGYRSCVADMITLMHMIDKERPEASPLRRLRLNAAQDMAARSLERAQYVIPLYALRITHV